MNLNEIKESNVYIKFNKLIYDKLQVISNREFNEDFDKCEAEDQKSALNIFIEENK